MEFPTVETLGQNVRHALRLTRRAHAFTVTALGTLTLGIGLDTAISPSSPSPTARSTAIFAKTRVAAVVHNSQAEVAFTTAELECGGSRVISVRHPGVSASASPLIRSRMRR